VADVKAKITVFFFIRFFSCELIQGLPIESLDRRLYRQGREAVEEISQVLQQIVQIQWKQAMRQLLVGC
jgi:ribose 1,5-bisphosphokinase PhnN